MAMALTIQGIEDYERVAAELAFVLEDGRHAEEAQASDYDWLAAELGRILAD